MIPDPSLDRKTIAEEYANGALYIYQDGGGEVCIRIHTITVKDEQTTITTRWSAFRPRKTAAWKIGAPSTLRADTDFRREEDGHLTCHLPGFGRGVLYKMGDAGFPNVRPQISWQP